LVETCKAQRLYTSEHLMKLELRLVRISSRDTSLMTTSEHLMKLELKLLPYAEVMAINLYQ